MKKLLLFLSLTTLSNCILGMTSKKNRLKREKFSESIQISDLNDISLNKVKYELEERAEKLNHQKKSYLARIDHFCKQGIAPLFTASFFTFFSYELMKESYNSEFSSFKRSVFILGATGLGYLG